ncbi:hypothetical protein MAM1_0123d05924 [Mucor ambiguus]|uniref:Uncharacterized protein n=1 Tax=Mucor ambiguus TaxID=91626 RepID=A0A0C9M827_9FUNG|nr:hypothetical protein MAM1_0123d05924 [Mucor ambiguus]
MFILIDCSGTIAQPKVDVQHWPTLSGSRIYVDHGGHNLIEARSGYEHNEQTSEDQHILIALFSLIEM